MPGSLSAWSKHERQLRIERRAAAEATWFYEVLGGRVPEGASPEESAAARRIERWVRQLPSFHRGAFSLRYTRREWPSCLVEEFGQDTSLVVRLECARHPAVGKSDAEIEAASVERLTTAIAACAGERARRKERNRTSFAGRNERPLAALAVRAHQHIASAIRALAKVRGNAPCMVPSWVEEEVDECE